MADNFCWPLKIDRLSAAATTCKNAKAFGDALDDGGGIEKNGAPEGLLTAQTVEQILVHRQRRRIQTGVFLDLVFEHRLTVQNPSRLPD